MFFLSPATRKSVKDILTLAAPIALSRFGLELMSIVVTMMVGHFSTQQLAYQALGLTPFMFLLFTSFGLMTGTLVLCSQSFGAGRTRLCARIFRHSLPLAVAVGIVGFLLCLAGPGFFLLTGQTPRMAREAGQVLFFLGLSLPPALVFMTTAYFLESIRRPMIAVWAMAGANLVNLALNRIFVYGLTGVVPPMGAVGSAWATASSRYILAGGLLLYVLQRLDSPSFGLRASLKWRRIIGRKLIRFGAASGGGVGIEEASFACLILMVGWLGPQALAGFSISLNVLGLAYTLCISLGTATASRVSAGRGRKDPAYTRRATLSGVVLCLGAMCLCALGLTLFPDSLAGLYTTDPDLIARTRLFFGFAALIAFFDGTQLMMSYTLRGYADIWFPTGAQLIVSGLIALPLAYSTAFVFDLGIRGIYGSWLFWGVGLFLVFILRLKKTMNAPDAAAPSGAPQ